MAAPAPTPAPAAVGGAGAAAVGGAGAAAPLPNVYSFFGHSSTIGPRLPIPAGCMLVTLALCGDLSYFDVGRPMNQFCAFFQELGNAHFLADPIRYRETIQKAVGGMQIGINYPGAPNERNRTYLDTQFNSELTHVYAPGAAIPGYLNPADLQQKCHLHRSGLYQAGTINLHPELLNVNDLDTNGVLLRNTIEWMFPREVLYPARLAVQFLSGSLAASGINGINLIRAIGARFPIRQRDLFAMRPGIHYLVTCRIVSPAAPPHVAFNVGLRRQESRAAPNAVINYNHNPKGTDPSQPIHRLHRGYLGSRYRLPAGVRHTNYIYFADRGPQLIGANANGREIIEIVRRGGGIIRQTKSKRRPKGKRKYTHKRRK
jgi:hypothetical protein